MALFHRRQESTAIEAAPIPVPRFSIDGWTLAGDPLVFPAPRSCPFSAPPEYTEFRETGDLHKVKIWDTVRWTELPGSEGFTKTDDAPK